jgi:homoserine kinase
VRATPFRAGPVRVRVPATSANLGPAFDCAGLALALYDEVVVRVASAGLTVDVAGQGSRSLPRDGRHLVVSALRATFDQLGGQPPGLEVACTNRIPQSRGLGSSSAAIVAAVRAARALVLDEDLDPAACLGLAAAIEGHPDNVAACLLGGFTLAWTDADGVHAHRAEVHASILPVVFVPTATSSTQKVRGLLPDVVPHTDAARSVGRGALLSLALTSEPSLLLAATKDWLHQPYRAEAMPRTAALVEQLRADGVPAVVSGAGSSVLALVTTGGAAAVAGRAPEGWTVLPLRVDAAGAVLLPSS